VANSSEPIGRARVCLKTRLDQYRIGHFAHPTNVLVMKNLIARTLSNGERVKILFAMPKPLEWPRSAPIRFALDHVA